MRGIFQPQGVGVSFLIEKGNEMDFKKWWKQQGKKLQIFDGETRAQFFQRVQAIAFQNSVYDGSSFEEWMKDVGYHYHSVFCYSGKDAAKADWFKVPF